MVSNMPSENESLESAETIHSTEATGGESAPPSKIVEQLARLQIVKEETLRQVKIDDADKTAELLEGLQRTGQITAFQRFQIEAGKLDTLRFDDYLLLDQLGGGGMGDVFKAKNVELERIEAIKMIRPVDADNDRVLYRLKREAIALAQMEHPCIVPVYKVGRIGAFGYIAMKFIDGEDLHRRIRRLRDRNEQLDVATACRWTRDIADALHHAHQRGIVHRDVKPSNLMIDSNDNIVLMDLGIARLVDPEIESGVALTKARHALGTPQYMPPEQWVDAHDVTAASDVYSLACTLYYALAGATPFPSSNAAELMRAHAFKPIPALAEVRLDVPEELDKVIARATAKDPADRYRTAREFAEALDPFLQPTTLSNTAVKKYERPKEAKFGLLGWSIAAAALVLTGLGFWYWHTAAPIESVHDQASAPAQATPPSTPETPAGNAISDPQPPQTEPSPAKALQLPAPPSPPTPPDWLVEFQQRNQDVWPDMKPLFEQASRFADAEGLNRSLIEPMGKLYAETVRLRRMRNEQAANAWLLKFAEEHPVLWPTPAELTAFARETAALDALDGEQQWKAVQEAVEKETAELASPLEPMNQEVFPEFWTRTAYPVLSELLAVHSSSRDPNWLLRLSFVDESGRRVESVPRDVEVFLQVRSSRDAHLTVVQFDAQDFMVLPLSKTVRADRVERLDEPAFAFGSPGVKRLMIYATDKPFADEVVIPVQNEEPLMRKWFKSPRAFSRVERVLEEGIAYPGFSASRRVESWTRQIVTIRVE